MSSVVDLEITSKQHVKHFNEEDYFKNRPDIVGVISSKAHTSSTNSFTIDELIINLYAKKASTKDQKNFVYVLGDEGSGKKIVVETLLKKYSKNELFHLKYVFLLQCRYIEFNTKTTLFQLLAANLPYDWICDESITENVVEKLKQSKKMLIIIEDLYFAQKHFSFSSNKSSEQLFTAEYFIEQILMQTIFPKAQVLITSHLHFFFKLNETLRTHQTFEVLDLSTKNQLKICENFSTGQTSKLVHKCINGHGFLKILCGSLEFCTAVAHVINAFSFPENGSFVPFFSLPLTRVTIAAYAVLLRSKNLQANVRDLEQLSLLAWSQINQKRLKNLSEVALLEYQFEVIHSFINVIRVQENKTVRAARYFHFLWLEILAAFYCAFKMDVGQFKSFLEEAIDSSIHSPLWFVAIHVGGLFDDVTQNYTKKLFPSSFFSSRFHDKMVIMKTWIQNCIAKPKKPLSYSSFLFSCCIAHSMQDKDLAVAISSQLDNSISISGNLYSTDLAGLYFVLQNRKDSLLLRVTPESIFLETHFFSFLHALLNLPHLKVIKFLGF